MVKAGDVVSVAVYLDHGVGRRLALVRAVSTTNKMAGVAYIDRMPTHTELCVLRGTTQYHVVPEHEIPDEVHRKIAQWRLRNA